jgi:hypothetical protein
VASGHRRTTAKQTRKRAARLDDSGHTQNHPRHRGGHGPLLGEHIGQKGLGKKGLRDLNDRSRDNYEKRVSVLLDDMLSIYIYD